MVNAKANFIDRFKVNVKLKAPHGIRLTQGETEALVELQEKDVKVLKENQSEVVSALDATRSIDVKRETEVAQSARSVALATYKRTKDPIKKREWARRLVVANHALKSLQGLSKRMSATHDRLMMIKGDLELQVVEAQARVAETKAYAKAGKQLRLAGESLVNARSRAKNSAIEYTNLEITMEGAEKLINNSKPEELLYEADIIAGRRRK